MFADETVSKIDVGNVSGCANGMSIRRRGLRVDSQGVLSHTLKCIYICICMYILQLIGNRPQLIIFGWVSNYIKCV